MALIFTASTDLGSTQHTSRIIGPLLRFFSPNVSDETIHDVQVLVRKAGHMTGYAVLSALVWRARQRSFFLNKWNWPAAGFTEGVCIAYAISDEFHQSFVPSRMASAWDVLIDATGAALALAAIWTIGRMRAKW